jgi:DNA-binding beta-propeller fold protein YncE
MSSIESIGRETHVMGFVTRRHQRRFGVVMIALALSLVSCTSGNRPRLALPPVHQVVPTTSVVVGNSYLASGSDPSVLPGPIVIADRGNNRLVEIDPYGRTLWEFPRQGDLAPGQTFKVPDDVFFTPDGTQMIATQEDDFVVTVIDAAAHKIVWRYGTPGAFGSGSNQLWNPDDAIMLRDGRIIVADIKNCRVVFLTPASPIPERQLGRTGHCSHRPPSRFASPNGAFPIPDGRIVVTEISGDWISAMTLTGIVAWSTHAPGVRYPSDTNQIAPDRYLTVDFSKPGKIVEFDHHGRLLWRYAPTGPSALNHPSLAEPLPNGDILATDDDNNRVIVVDPKTNTIVWQYGHTGVDGRASGYLADPDGADLTPPHSYMSAHVRQ